VAIVQDPKKRAQAEMMSPTMVELLEPRSEVCWSQESVLMMSDLALLKKVLQYLEELLQRLPRVEYPSRRKERFGERCGLEESTVKPDDEEIE
jgi:hypothetical protein